MNKDNKLHSLYSTRSNSIFEKYMSLLFPCRNEEYTNFGYWKNLPFPKTIKDMSIRIASQRSLYEFVHSMLKLQPKQKVLEVGCGKGYAVKKLCQKGIECFGVDALEDQIQACKKKHKKFKNNFIQGCAESLPFNDDVFDVVYSVEAAQHFLNFYVFTHEARRLLHKKGKICITTYFLNADDNREATNEILPPTIEGTDRIISIDYALDCLSKAGFDSLSYERIGKNVFPQFAHWQKIVIQILNYPKPLPERQKWARYYSMDNTDKPHPWLEAYQERFIDYFVIKNF